VRQPKPSRALGRMRLALLLVISAAVLASALWLPRVLAPRTTVPSGPVGGEVEPPAPEVAPGAIAEPTPPPVELEQGAERARSLAAEPELPHVLWLRIELVDERGAPVTGDLELRLNVHLGWTAHGRGVGPTRVETVRGPRVELPVESSSGWDPGSLRERVLATVVVRRLGLYADTAVPLVRAEDESWARVVLKETSVVRGLLLGADGNPLEGVDVLVRFNMPEHTPHSSARTDADGSFAVEAFPWLQRNLLFVGDARYPWVPVVDLGSEGGTRVLDPIRIELHAASFQVLRHDGNPAAGARLDGFGLEGGRFGVQTDAEGRARITTLVRGRWRLNAADDVHGRASRAVQIPPERDETVLLMLPR